MGSARPEAPQSRARSQRPFRLAGLFEEVEHRADVVVLGVQAVEARLWVAAQCGSMMAEGNEVVGVRRTHHVVLARFDQRLCRELTDHLEHREAVARMNHEAFFNKGLQIIDIRIADRLCCLKRAAAAKD